MREAKKNEPNNCCKDGTVIVVHLSPRRLAVVDCALEEVVHQQVVQRRVLVVRLLDVAKETGPAKRWCSQ